MLADASVRATEAQGRAAELVAAGAARLRMAGSPSARLDAELLVAHAFGRDRAWLRAHPDGELSGDAVHDLQALLERRASGEPIAYIRGFKEWLSLRLLTDRRALIPRPETELLAEVAITEIASRLANQARSVTVWEIGTGCGAVGVALGVRFGSALALGRLSLTVSDVSPEALELAAENHAAHGTDRGVRLACGSLLEPMAALERTDLLVANLPYLATHEVRARRGSLAWEPSLALDGGADGLDLVRELVAGVGKRARMPETMLLEIGAGQAAAVSSIMAGGLPGSRTSFVRDLAGIDRVARVEVTGRRVDA